MLHGLYTFFYWLLFITVGPIFLLYGLLSGSKLAGVKQRLGFFLIPFQDKEDNVSTCRLWFHAASVGEVQVAKALIVRVATLIPNSNFIVTTMTEQGHKVALEQLAPFAVTCLYAPIDLPWVVKRFIRMIRPTVYICLETELWPNMIKTASESGLKLLLLNGRISENSSKNYQLIRPLLKNLLNRFLNISTIMPHDRDRFISLGAENKRVIINGNAKYDSLPFCASMINKKKAAKSAIIEHYRQMLDIGEKQPVFIAGSTHTGEEEIILNVYKKLKKEIIDLLLIVAPRHIKRSKEIERLLKKNELTYCIYASLSTQDRSSDIILLDSMGDLASIYSVGTYIFCGGSLVPKGGHNLMEPALWGVPPLYGPYTDDFSDAKIMLETGDAGFTIDSADELYDKVVFFHHNKEAYKHASTQAEKIALVQQGSANRQALLITDLI